MAKAKLTDIVKVAGRPGLFVVIAIEGNVYTVTNEHGLIVHTSENHVYLTGHSVQSVMGDAAAENLLESVAERHKPKQQITATVAVPTPKQEPTEAEALIEYMERENRINALLDELNHRRENGYSKRKIHRTIRKLHEV